MQLKGAKLHKLYAHRLSNSKKFGTCVKCTRWRKVWHIALVVHREHVFAVTACTPRAVLEAQVYQVLALPVLHTYLGGIVNNALQRYCFNFFSIHNACLVDMWDTENYGWKHTRRIMFDVLDSILILRLVYLRLARIGRE